MKIAIIDGDVIPFLACHNKANYDPKSLEQVKDSVDYLINRFLVDIEATGYIGYLQGGNNFRRLLYPSYKAQRKKLEIPFFFEARQYMIDHWKFILTNFGETDDHCVATRKKVENSVLVSNDKDILLLNGSCFNPVKRVYVDTTVEEAHKHFWLSMLTGDKADNVDGLKGVGPVRANQLLKDAEHYPEFVLSCYISHHHSIEKGIEEYYKNFKLLHILDEIPNFEIPTPIPYETTKITPKIEDEFSVDIEFGLDNIKIETPKDEF